MDLVHPLCYLFESLTNGFMLSVNRERKYNHTCVVALQIGALSMNGSRQVVFSVYNHKYYPCNLSFVVRWKLMFNSCSKRNIAFGHVG